MWCSHEVSVEPEEPKRRTERGRLTTQRGTREINFTGVTLLGHELIIQRSRLQHQTVRLKSRRRSQLIDPVAVLIEFFYLAKWRKSIGPEGKSALKWPKWPSLESYLAEERQCISTNRLFERKIREKEIGERKLTTQHITYRRPQNFLTLERENFNYAFISYGPQTQIFH